MDCTKNKFEPFLVDLPCQGYRGESLPFKVEIYSDALLELLKEAEHGLRVYELFAIRRPGDIKKYLWVGIIDVTPRVSRTYAYARERTGSKYVKEKWPENECPYDIWDDLFFMTWDEEPADYAWLNFKRSQRITQYIDQLYEAVCQLQQQLKISGDLIAKGEIASIENHTHFYDYDAYPPFLLTHRSASEFIWSQHEECFYAVLGKLLDKPDIHSVAYRYGEDIRAFRMVCNEQKRRENACDEQPHDAFQISVLTNSLPNANAWGCKVTYYDEGLGDGDLYIDTTDGADCSVKELFENYKQPAKYILAVKDFGEIVGYLHDKQEGVHVYTYTKCQ